MEDKDQRYLNPHISGILIGIIITFFYFLYGCEISIADVFPKIVSYCYSIIFTESYNSSKFMYRVGEAPINNIMLFLAFGISIGAFISALINKRIEIKLERGKTCKKIFRVILASIGGFLTSFGIAYMNGGLIDIALCNFTMQTIGGFLFLVSFFIFGYIFSFLFWGQWHD